MEYDTRQILPDWEQDATSLDAFPAICARCSLKELEAIGASLFGVAKKQAGAAAAERSLGDTAWVWLALSLTLHALLLLSLVHAGVFSFTPSEPPLETVVELSFGGLSGSSGAGGEGPRPGGGREALSGGVGAAAPQSSPATPPAKDRAVAAPQPPPPPPAETALLRSPDTPSPKEKRPELPREPAPKAQAKPRAEPPHPSRRPRPVETAPAPPPAAVSLTAGQAPGGSAGTEQITPGPGGPGQGQGPGLPPGTGGLGQAGPGGGGGGEYVGQFGQGDGPTFRHRTLPQYPSEARRDEQEGRVVLRLSLSADGELKNAAVVEQTGLEFAEAALRAVRASSYFPAKRNGHAVPCQAMLTIRFKLD